MSISMLLFMQYEHEREHVHYPEIEHEHEHEHLSRYRIETLLIQQNLLRSGINMQYVGCRLRPT